MFGNITCHRSMIQFVRLNTHAEQSIAGTAPHIFILIMQQLHQVRYRLSRAKVAKRGSGHCPNIAVSVLQHEDKTWYFLRLKTEKRKKGSCFKFSSQFLSCLHTLPSNYRERFGGSPPHIWIIIALGSKQSVDGIVRSRCAQSADGSRTARANALFLITKPVD